LKKCSRFTALVISFLFAYASLSPAINLSDYDHLDPQHLVPTTALEQAVTYYDQIKGQIKNPDVLTIIDYSQHSSRNRFFLINMKTGAVETLKVAHGQGSDSNHDGWAERYSNKPNSKATSLGFYLTDTTYTGSHGTSLRMDGLSTTNSNARARAIVVHGADYVSDARNKLGRSWGCPALDLRHARRVIDRIKHGSLIYAWAGQKTVEQRQVAQR
jgi:hypothetical protein